MIPEEPPLQPKESDPSDVVFEETELNDILLVMTPEDKDALLNSPEYNVYYPASFRWKNVVFDQIGISRHGDLPSRPKESFDLRFNKYVSGQTFFGLRVIKLKGMADDPSMMRDRLSYGLFRARIAGPRAVHVRLFLNADYWGLYFIEERIDDGFFRRQFGGELGNLYRVRHNGGDVYAWNGEDVAEYVPFPFAPESNVETADHSRVVSFVDLLTRDPSAIGSLCDVAKLLNFLAVETAIINNHGVGGDPAPDNHYQYYRLESGRFHILPWDLDSTWNSDPERDIFKKFQNVRLTAAVANVPQFRDGYKQRIGEVIETVTRPDLVAARVDFLYAQIRDAAHADAQKPWTNAQFDGETGWIKDLAQRRYVSLKTQISQP